ncbi:MAG TPA: sensor histidine kinase [Opitutaceae bacterium]|nr:sensor histidine kinase [Opitutaceae bacterium]
MALPRYAAVLFLALSLPMSGQDADELPLSRAADLRKLSVEEAQEGHRVRLRGVVVFGESSAVFVRDETATIFFRPRPEHVVKPGDEVEVIGPTRMGLYLPGIALADTVKIIGQKPLPEPLLVTFDDITTARYHYQHVAVEGVVRSLHRLADDRSMMRIAADSRTLEVRVDAPMPDGEELVDCRVRVSGLAAGFINDRRQVVQSYVRLQSWANVTVLESATPENRIPLLSAADLLAYRPTGPRDRRIQIEGQVLAAFPGGEIYLRQGQIGFAANVVGSQSILVGDQVTLQGFPVMTAFAAAVDDAKLASRKPGSAPEPILVETVDSLERVHHAELVQLTATVVQSFTTPEGVTLLLKGKGAPIRAQGVEGMETPAAGSRVRVVGICLVKAQPGAGFNSQVGAISLKLRSPSDLSVLQGPSWWTVRRLAVVLVGVLGVTALAGLWIASLRRQVRRQTDALRHRIQSEAAIQERHRIAREFHDSLEQELAGVSLRLDALETRITDEKGKQLAAASRNLVARIQVETRSLIADLRDPVEMARDLPTALQQVAARQAADHGIQTHVNCEDPTPTLPEAVVHDLRMITREAITNARKHGQATKAEVSVVSKEGTLCLQISDNGSGFEPARLKSVRRGHFGCAGIVERARKLGGSVRWEKTSEGGAVVVLLLPLQGRPPANRSGEKQGEREHAESKLR